MVTNFSFVSALGFFLSCAVSRMTLGSYWPFAGASMPMSSSAMSETPP